MSLDSVVLEDVSLLSFEEVFCSFEIVLGVVAQLAIFDFGWFSGGEIVSGFLLIVELDDSFSWEESSSSSETVCDAILSLEVLFSF